MDNNTYTKIRNVAIIAHVDHGKTTLVDGFLKQTHVFRENEENFSAQQILDYNDLERERGITILAKTASINYKGYKINIIDTPGHSDFGGEVEKTLNMADGCLLIIDAQEGPMPQTYFVLKKALELNKSIILVINKIDKSFANPANALDKAYDLFLSLAINESQLDFPVFYAIGKDGKAYTTIPANFDDPADLSPILEKVIEYFPHPEPNIEGSLQLQVTLTDFDKHLGTLCIGKVIRGTIEKDKNVVILKDNSKDKGQISKVFVMEGLKRVEKDICYAGDIVIISGIKDVTIGDTIAGTDNPEALPRIQVQEPSVRIKIEASTSPFLGRDGKFLTSREIGVRLEKEVESNLSMKLEKTGDGGFFVSGRGELHLGILIETLRRENYEFQISKPTVVIKGEGNNKLEPLEEVFIEVNQDYFGTVSTIMTLRSANLLNIETRGNISMFHYEALTKNMFGLRTELLSQTRGTATINVMFSKFVPYSHPLPSTRNGALCSTDTGTATSYALEKIEDRGNLFISPGDEVYTGMVIGIAKYDNDMNVNPTLQKQKTSIHMSVSEIAIKLKEPMQLTLDNLFQLLEDDEVLEITPKFLRLRKRVLDPAKRSIKRETRG